MRGGQFWRGLLLNFDSSLYALLTMARTPFNIAYEARTWLPYAKFETWKWAESPLSRSFSSALEFGHFEMNLRLDECPVEIKISG